MHGQDVKPVMDAHLSGFHFLTVVAIQLCHCNAAGGVAAVSAGPHRRRVIEFMFDPEGFVNTWYGAHFPTGIYTRGCH